MNNPLNERDRCNIRPRLRPFGGERGVVCAMGVALTVALAGCSESVKINSRPPDAKVFVDDTYIGQSPATFVERSHHVKSSYGVRVERTATRQ